MGLGGPFFFACAMIIKRKLDLRDGDFFLDGPVFIKSGVTLAGTVTDDAPGWTFFIVYDGPKTTAAGEDAVVVIDGAIDAEVSHLSSCQPVPGTIIVLRDTENQDPALSSRPFVIAAIFIRRCDLLSMRDRRFVMSPSRCTHDATRPWWGKVASLFDSCTLVQHALPWFANE